MKQTVVIDGLEQTFEFSEGDAAELVALMAEHVLVYRQKVLCLGLPRDSKMDLIDRRLIEMNVLPENWLHPLGTQPCHRCGDPFFIDDSGVANHLDALGDIDYESDADHTPFRLGR